MTGRKYHLEHCPSCKWYFKNMALEHMCNEDLSQLKGATAIKCTKWEAKL